MKIIWILLTVFFTVIILTSCNSDANIASKNLSVAADNFEVNRRIVFYNGINWEYILTIQGRCSLWNYDPSRELSVTCKIWNKNFKKHFLWLSDNVTYFVEQVETNDVSAYNYRVIFKPLSIIPDIEIK